ncbi:MAG TPA: hypothetical protein VEU73_06575 [Gemmatimonadales bacterium]|nr:hypothetical protein [Gemmatimonadales bacterium]
MAAQAPPALPPPPPPRIPRLDASGRQMLAFWVLLAVTVGGSAAITYFGFETLSAVRAYVGGEGLWSKAQKDATYRLVRHARGADWLKPVAYVYGIVMAGNGLLHARSPRCS